MTNLDASNLNSCFFKKVKNFGLFFNQKSLQLVVTLVIYLYGSFFLSDKLK